MPRTTAPPFRTNPSAIARYFFHDCERFLHFSAATPEQRRATGIPTPEFDQSPLVEAILASGYQWEREVIDTLLKGRVVIAPGSGELHTRRLSVAQTIRHLRKESAGRFLYQPTLSPPAQFYEEYGIDPKQVTISDNHPDLLAVLPGPDNSRLLRVVDLKRGESLKLTHRVQILLYALELQALLDAEGIEGTSVDLEQGAVWLGKQPEAEAFKLGDFRPHLERFLRQDLTRILSTPARDVSWHLYDRCEWCEFFNHCRDEMRETNDVSRLVQLTTYGKRHLREEAGVRTLPELGRFLKRKDADEVLDRCASLAGQRHRLQMRVEALETQEPQLHGAASPDLPQGENIAVFLTLQKEPLSQTIYLAGVYVTAREEVRRQVYSPAVLEKLVSDENKNQPYIWLARRPEEVANVRRGFIELLSDLFRRVHDYNAKREWKDQLTLQAYVHTEADRSLLFALLLDALQEPDLAEQAMTLLFHFQGPELMHADRHPQSEVAYPVVVLLNAVSRLLALPVEVSYTLPEMLDALDSNFAYTRRDYYHFPLGHGLRAEALHAAWYRGKTDNLDEIHKQARLYLLAVASLLRAVRERAATHLFGWPPKFTLPTGAGIREPLLSRLAFFTRYESLLRCLAVREARAEARPTQVLLGQVIELKAVTSSEMEVVGELVVEPEASSFPAWLLVRDSDDGRRAQIEYADYWYRNKMHGGPQNEHRAIVAVQEVHTPAKGPTRLRLSNTGNFKNRPPQRGERFLLYERFTDFTTDPVVKFLEELDGQADVSSHLFLRLLRDPEATATPQPLPKKAQSHADRFEGTLGFTPSQRDAFHAIARQRVTAVWGPPGTGKTHFLASLIVGFAAAHARAGLPFRVLVTAFTHAAIENLLRKIRQRQVAFPGVELLLGKAKYWQGAASDVEQVPESDLASWLDESEHVVLGATAYSCLKKRDELSPFDLVVIDEASQVRVPEAAIAVHLAGDAGRIVLAGDHLQLPPIIAGVYPDAPPGEPLLHRSIFEAVVPNIAPASGRDRTHSKTGVMRTLLENFRMNDVLTSVAAQLLYGPRYRCFDDTIAARRLNYHPKGDNDPLVAACLDPAFPLVVVILNGLRTAKANPIEADLVAQLVAALRDGSPYRDDAEFFRQGVFVVSPHHAQIHAIQHELAKQRAWTATPFVDTVDKMQGQEADAVIVSYGVADPEFALREAEFIYGLNRLNVAVTRARMKCVVCLPRPLLEASPQVLDQDAAATGLAFMRRLVEKVAQQGNEVVFEGDGVEARVLRADRVVGA